MGDLDKLIYRTFDILTQVGLPYVGRRGRRDTLAVLFAQAGFNCGAEIGVMDGVYSEVLCKANPKLKLKGIDTWTMTSRATGELKTSQHYNNARKVLTKYGVELLKMTSMEAAKIVPSESLDFVYIDADHKFDEVMLDIIEWSKRVRVGGIVAGHDYFHFRNCEVPQAVDAYTQAHNIHQWYITREDYPPSWFWVKI